jgi:putative chitinase
VTIKTNLLILSSPDHAVVQKYFPSKPNSKTKTMTTDQIKYGAGASSTYAAKFMSFLADTCDKYQITTPARQLCFLAQVGHESGGLFYTEELASGKAYEGRADLGNTQTGDGVKFKGRGLIQITGRANYKALGDSFGVDLITDPSLLGGRNVTTCTTDQLKYAAMSAGWFWNTHRLNDIADQIDIQQAIDSGNNLVHFKEITKKINGGYNGLADRLTRYTRGISFFK